MRQFVLHQLMLMRSLLAFAALDGIACLLQLQPSHEALALVHFRSRYRSRNGASHVSPLPVCGGHLRFRPVLCAAEHWEERTESDEQYREDTADDGDRDDVLGSSGDGMRQPL